MRGRAWPARTGTTAPLFAAVVLAAVLLAGCGAGDNPAATGPRQARTLAAATAGPRAFTRTQAERLARTLLTRARLPRGVRVLVGRPPSSLGQSPDSELGGPSVELHALWTAAAPMSAVRRYWSGHRPAGLVWDGSGQGAQWNVVTQEFVGYELRRLPAGVETASLTMTVVPAGPARSVIRADVQVIWYPPRSAAEYVPAGMHTVTVTASAGVGPSPRRVTKTISAPAVVRRLAAMLNGAYAAPQGSVFSCPAAMVSYRLAFAGPAGSAPYLVATETGCPGMTITAGGRPQPRLELPAGLTRLLGSLTGVPMFPAPAAHARRTPQTAVGNHPVKRGPLLPPG